MTFAKGWHFESSAKPKGLCPACNAYDKPKGGVLKRRFGKNGGSYMICSRYPDCKFTKGIRTGENLFQFNGKTLILYISVNRSIRLKRTRSYPQYYFDKLIEYAKMIT